jgi:RNA polymerase sigma-70 factor (ECF subfamily)
MRAVRMNQPPDLKAKTDEELVRLTLKDREIFGVLMKRYEARLKRYIRRISNCRAEEAEDVLQDAFIKAYQNLNSFDHGQKFSSWMYRIARNQVISNYRKIRSRAEGHSEPADEDALRTLASKLDVRKEMEEGEARAAVSRVLNAMDVKYRDVLVLKYLEEKDYREMSDILKKPMGTVATLLFRAKKKFREQAEKMGVLFTSI